MSSSPSLAGAAARPRRGGRVTERGWLGDGTWLAGRRAAAWWRSRPVRG